MADSIDAIIQRRLERSGLADEVAIYVMAALDGTLDQLIDSESEQEKAERPRPAVEAAVPARAFLKRVSVTGFRGVGPQAELEVVPGLGLTLVVGANETGKSSFAEGLEFLLTGENSRWEGKAREWQQGWRNIHSDEATLLRAEFAVERADGSVVVSRRWHPEATELDDHTTDTETAGKRRAGLDALGWESALETHRPFLSYSQLSEIVEEDPSALFDAMAAGLGLERLTEACQRLRGQRRDDERTIKAAREALHGLLDGLKELDDERARTVSATLADEPWNPYVIPLVWEGVIDDDADRPLDLLKRLAGVKFPSTEEVKDCHDELHRTFEWLDGIDGSNGARAARLAWVIQAMLRVHEHEGNQPCPVCQAGQIDGRWRATAEDRLINLKDEVALAHEATALLFGVVEKCETLVSQPPDWLADAERVGIDASEVRRAWDWWERSLDDEPGLPDLDAIFEAWQPASRQDHPVVISQDGVGDFSPSTLTLSAQGLLEVAGRLIERGAGVRAALAPLREQARAELNRREDLWRPLWERLLDWQRDGGQRDRAEKAGARFDAVQAGEDWLAGEEHDIRAERFRPIARRARLNWKELGRDSSVSLDDLELTGRANDRRLNLATTIDGQDGAALAVMSPGELNALSLSLFLARAVLPESPFGFLVIDDPVQAMGPVKLEGLARVLAEAAGERQVIVFTHDERLPAMVRRLRIEHQVLAVRRRERSVVTCTPVENPVQQHLDDARAVLLTEGLGDLTRRRVVPGFCRQAIEAACIEAVWRNRTEAGRGQAETEEDINHAQTLNDKLKILLLGDPDGDHHEMRNRLGQDFGRRARDVVDACNRGVHGKWSGEMDALIDATDSLVKRIVDFDRR